MKYRLQDLIDIEHFQNLQDRLNKIYSFPSSIIDNDGHILTATAWQDVCSNFHRKNKECEQACIKSDQYILDHLHEADPAVTYRCPHGLVDNATPIIIDGIHYGNFFTGQFFLEEEPDLELFRARARKYGFDEASYIEAVKKVPVWTQEQLDNYLFFIKGLIAVISESGLKTLKEIENRKKIEESEQRHRSILKTAMDGYLRTNLDGNLIEVNDAYCRMSGYASDELVSMHISDLEDREDASTIAERLRSLVEKGSDRFESQHRRKDGGVFYVEVSVQYRSDDGGQFISFVRDCTDRKRAEAERRKLAAQLASAMEMARLGHWEYDVQSDMFTFNNQFFHIFGTTADQIGQYSMSSAEYARQFVHPEDREMVAQEIRKSLETNDPDFSRQLEHRIIYADGKVGHISVRYFIIKDDRGNTIRTYGVNQDITERKVVEEALRYSENKFRSLVEQAAEMLFLHDLQGNLVDVNLTAVKNTGDRMDELKTMSVFDIDPDALNRDDMRVYWQSLEPGDSPVRFEVRHRRKDHTIYPAEVSVSKVVLHDGEYILGLARDITQSKQAEAALRDSEEKFRELANMLPQIVFEMDRNGKLIFVNQNAFDTFEYTMDDFASGLNAIQMIAPSDRDRAARNIQRILAGEAGILANEYVAMKKEGAKLPVIVYSSPVLRDGAPDGIRGIMVDISERKFAEEQLRRSEEKYRTIFENVNEGILIAQDEKLKLVNKAAENILENDAETLTTKPFTDFIHPDDRNIVLDRYRRRISGENAETGYEFRIVAGSGDVKWVKIHSSFIKWEGQPSTINFIEDVTEQKRLQESIAQVQKMESIGSLAGGIAHDFNNILFPIIGMAEMMIEDLPDGSLLQQSAKEIFKAGTRGSDLVKQILAFSRQSEHKLIPTRAQKVIEDALRLCRRTIPSDIEIQQELGADCGLVMADPTQLQQVGMNLITNAFHAVEEKSGKISVTLEAATIGQEYASTLGTMRPGHFVKMTVTDNGVGIDPSIKDKIFDPYFTTKAQGKGTGLGLAVVYGIVKDWGGEIAVHSEPGKGTTFELFLPVVQGSEEPVKPIARRSFPAGTETILLVDDEAAIVALEQKMLERLGYGVVVRTSSVAALKVFRENPNRYDLVLSDMSMPNLTGDRMAIELLRIRPDIPIVLCTGFSERIDQKKADDIGVKGLLMKPVTMSDLSTMVRNVLDEAKGRREQ